MSIINTIRLVKKSVIVAARKKAAEQRADYRITSLQTVPAAYYVKGPNATYIVDTIVNKCDCPAFKADGFCKHFAMIQNDRREDAELEARRIEQEYANADREEGS